MHLASSLLASLPTAPSSISLWVIISTSSRERRRIRLLQRGASRSLYILLLPIDALFPPPLLPLQPLIITILFIPTNALISSATTVLRVLDEVVDDPVLQRVHDEREDEHDERDLQGGVALGPAERPVADPCNPGEEGEDGEDAELHEEQAEEVDDGLLEPPCGARGLAVVAGADGLGWVGEGGVEGGAVEDFEEENEDRDAEGGLGVLV
jgi:hypothetical protein